MSRRTSRLLLAASAAAALLAGPALVAVPAAAAPPPGSQAEGVIAGAWIVTLNDGESPDRVADDHRRKEGAQVDHVYRHALNGYAARMSDTAAARVARDPRVQSVIADRVLEAVARPGGGGGTTSQILPTGINRIDGELSSVATATAGIAVDVAIIDTGIDVDHPDLDVVGGVNCSTGASYDDGNGHGTHVAGTVGAKHNTTGVVGVVPGAKLWAVRVLDNRGSGSWSSVICGIDWVTGRAPTSEGDGPKIEVANMSLGGTGTEPAGDGCVTRDALHDAVCRSVTAGVTYAVAAGNDATDAAGFVPAAYDEVITVSALADFDGLAGGTAAATCRSDVDDTFANFSNYGADIDVIAPGVCISSTWKGGGYKTISGTSMAAPHVAGAAALYKVKVPSAGPGDVKTALQNAGTLDWRNADDRDGIQEKLLNVSTF